MLNLLQHEPNQKLKLSSYDPSHIFLLISMFLTMSACQLTEKNISYDACLAGEAPCPEVCNGEDDDDDGLIDESLSEACIVLSSLKLERGDQSSGFGRAIVAVPDVNGDGISDLLVSSSRAPAEIDYSNPEEGAVSLIDGASLQIIRTVKYGGDFGQSLAVVNFGDENILWCSGAPSKEGENSTFGRVLCLDFEGNVISSIRSESAEGFGLWLSTRNNESQNQLIISEPQWQREGDNEEGAVGPRGRALFVSLQESELVIDQSIEGSNPGQQIAERIISIGDSNEDGINDFLLTGYADSESE
jgi:hypothetical protein